MVNETVGPYAYLTHSLRKSLTIRWTKTGKIEGTTQTRDAYDWDNRMANLPLPFAFVSLSLRLFATEGMKSNHRLKIQFPTNTS